MRYTNQCWLYLDMQISACETDHYILIVFVVISKEEGLSIVESLHILMILGRISTSASSVEMFQHCLLFCTCCFGRYSQTRRCGLRMWFIQIFGISVILRGAKAELWYGCGGGCLLESICRRPASHVFFGIPMARFPNRSWADWVFSKTDKGDVGLRTEDPSILSTMFHMATTYSEEPKGWWKQAEEEAAVAASGELNQESAAKSCLLTRVASMKQSSFDVCIIIKRRWRRQKRSWKVLVRVVMKDGIKREFGEDHHPDTLARMNG